MAHNFKGAPPLYLQIKNSLRQKIEADVYKNGDILPSENELQKMFNVSRITIRQAMIQLASEGYVYRIRGKGTIVKYNKISENLSNIISFTNEMNMRGLTAFTKSVEISIVKADKTAAAMLGVEKDEHIYKIERIRGANNTPFVIFISYFSLHKNLPLDKELYYESLYDILKKSCGESPVKATDYFEAICADENLSQKLDVKLGSPLLIRTRQSFNSAGEIFEYTICYYRADRYRYSITY